MRNKKAKVGSIIFVMIIGLVTCGFIFIVSVASYHEFFKYNDSCLQEIGIKVCEEQGKFYDAHYLDYFVKDKICCKNSEREVGKDEYLFLEEELERCEK